MLGVEDHRHVERVHHLRHLAERHVQEVGGVAEVVPRLHEVLAVPAALVVGDDRGQLGEQPDRFGQVGLGRRVGRLGVVGADDAHRGAHDIHRVRGQRQLVDDPLDVVVQGPQRTLEGLELGQLAFVGQLAVPEQVGDLLEGALRGELLHRVAAVQQRVGVRVDLGDRGVVDDDAGEALVDVSHR